TLDNPDLSSKDPEKFAAAHQEKRALAAKVQELDAIEKRTIATMTGQDPSKVAGRSIEQQVDQHYAEYVKKDPELKEPADFFRLGERDEDRTKRAQQVKDDHYATDELLDKGKLSTVTQVRRAEQKGDDQQKANLLEAVQSNADKK